MPPAAHIEQLHRQLDAWRRLAEAIERSQDALLRGNLAEFARSTETQVACCQQCQQSWAAEEQSMAASDTELLARVEQARHRVRHLNRVHADLLRRANRSLRILRHLLTGGAAYGPPQTPDQSLLSRERR